jgi:hypothetical protein
MTLLFTFTAKAAESRRLRWMGHTAYMKDKRNICKALVETSYEKRLFYRDVGGRILKLDPKRKWLSDT